MSSYFSPWAQAEATLAASLRIEDAEVRCVGLSRVGYDEVGYGVGCVVVFFIYKNRIHVWNI